MRAAWLALSLYCGVKLTHVPYKGGAPAMIDIVSGQVAGMLTSVATAESQIRTGRVRVIGVAGPKRLPAYVMTQVERVRGLIKAGVLTPE